MALIVGTPGADTLIGGDEIDGLGGNDILSGGEGWNETIGASNAWSDRGSASAASGRRDEPWQATR